MAAESRLTLVLNPSNAAVSQYTSYDFNSFAYHRQTDRLYATNSDGLWLLDSASTDNTTAISCYLQTMKMAIGGSDTYTRNFIRGYLNCRATGDVEITTTADGWEDPDTHTITNDKTDGSWQSLIIPVDGGAWGSQHTWKIANVDGCDLSVRALSMISSDRKTHNVFSGVTGINNRVDPALASHNPRTGTRDVAECVNMYVDDTLHAHCRKGYTLVTAGSFHSLFATPDGSGVYCARDYGTETVLCRIMPDGSGTVVQVGLRLGSRVWWVQHDGVVYYSNDYENGRVIGDVATTWPLLPIHPSEVVVSREFYAAPVGRHLASYNGRLYMAQGDTLWSSEWGSPQRWRRSTGHARFEGAITMVAAVGDGLYVSDSRHTHFLTHAGTSGTMAIRRVCDYPAIPGTLSSIEGGRILTGDVTQGVAAIWTSTEGICVGGSQAAFRNLTERRLTLPTSSEGSAVAISRHGQTSGTPTLYITSLAA